MRAVTRRNFWSPDKDGGHTIRSAVAENPMLYINFMILGFIEPEMPIAVLHCGNIGLASLDLFCSYDLDLDPMTFIYKHDPYSMETYRMSKYELST